jgi:hypothetical protein
VNAKQRRKQRRYRRGKGAYVGPWWIPYEENHGEQFNQPVLFGLNATYAEATRPLTVDNVMRRIREAWSRA